MPDGRYSLLIASLLCLASIHASAADNCEEPVALTIKPVAQYVDQGFRPLSEEEITEIQSKDNESADGWRPKTSEKDCEQKSSSMLEPEERGYRPLDYGTVMQKDTEESGDQNQQQPVYGGNQYWWNYPQGYGPGYMQGYMPGYGYGTPNYSPGYPAAPGNSWYQGNPWSQGSYGNYPYQSMPQFLPGYGIMPYMFGGSGFPW